MADETLTKLSQSLDRFRGVLTPEEIGQIQAIQSQPLPTGIRLNRLKVEPVSTIQALSERYGWTVTPVPFCDNAWTIHQATTSPGTTIEHRLGQYYLQDPVSMVPVTLFDINEPHPLILDIAASPGGKTTHLIDRTLDQGFILANDSSKSRISALRSVLANWGGINLAVTQYPGESFGAWYPETFDLILLDAPCSMENLRPTPNHPARDTTMDERLRLRERQIQLLISGLQALKVGGQLVYATCSLAPEEDESVVGAVLSAYPDAITIDAVADRFPFHTPGLTQFESQSFHPEMKNSLRLWPHLTGMSGFFCVRISKIGPIQTIAEPPPSRDFSRTDLQALSQPEKGNVIAHLSDHFAWNFAQVLLDNHLELYQRHDTLFMIPTSYLRHFNSLPYEMIGMPLGRWVGSRIEPTPEFISRFGHYFTQGKIQIDDATVSQWMDGRDIRHPGTHLSPKGQYLLVTDSADRNLGLGKLHPKRLRNMLPR